MNLKQIFCKHNFVDKCKIDKYSEENGYLVVKSYQELCSSRIEYKNCKCHDSSGNVFNYNCDYYYQQCTKCGKVKE